MTTITTIRDAMQLVRHDVPDPDALGLGFDESRSHVLLTVVGVGLAELHIENRRALRDLSELIFVLYMEWTAVTR